MSETQKQTEETAATDRRSFLAAAAVSAGVAGLAMAQQTEEPQTPKGLGPRAMVDNRFPLSYATSVPQGVNLLTQYFVALSERNLKGIADLLHFPFATFEGTEAVIVQTPADLLAHPPASLNMSTDPARFTANDGYLKPGAYDVLDGIEVLAYDPVLCGLSLRYNRYSSDGKKLHRCEGLYSITNNDGRWAIQMMSTIFTPAQMTGVVFTDTIEAAKRCRIDHDLAYQVSDRSVDAPTGQLGRTAAVANQGGQPWTLGPAGRAMEQFRVKGVKTRLRVKNLTPSGASAENPEPRPGTTSMISWVCCQYSNCAAPI